MRQIQKSFLKPKSRCTFTKFFTIKQNPKSRTNNYTRDIHTCHCINLYSCKFESDVRVILKSEFGTTRNTSCLIFFLLLSYILFYYRCRWPRGLRHGSAATLAGVAGSNPARWHVCLSLVSVICCQVEVSATGQSLVQRSRTECDVSDWDLETSTKRRPRSTRAKEP